MKIIAPALLALFAVVTTATCALAANTVALADRSGAVSTNYPLQFGRPFVQGEIANYPQALVNGVAIATQADVKNRHPDGSVKYAVIAAIVPTIPANGTVALSFQNQASGNNTALTVAQMTAAPYADAAIQIGAASATARAMLTAGKCKPWTQGQIAQTMMCADDSAARAYDVGPVRPRFYLTFWPGLSRVAVRYVGENILAGVMADNQYAMTLTLGGASVYTKPALIHPFGSRWTKTFWQGGAPQSKINIAPNLAYLASTFAAPNLDPATVIPETAIAADYAQWLTMPRDLYGAGLWARYMPTTGGRYDLGLMPDWAAKWLYTGDWRLREIALTNADLASAWGLHFREGRAGKKIDKAQTVDGVGLPLSVYAEPDLWFPDNNGIYGQGIVTTDRHTIITDPADYPTTAWGWEADTAHQPSPFLVPYLLTGDPYYLEEAQFWAAANALSIPPGMSAWGEGGDPGRGPGAGIGEQTRGVAWMFNNHAAAWSITPDDQTVMRGFLRSMIDDATALFEGRAGIMGTAFQGNAMWNYGRMPGVSLGTNPLHFASHTDAPQYGSTQWQQYMLATVLGWSSERGLPTAAYRDWVGILLTGQFAEPTYSRFNLGAYWVQVKTAAGVWFPTWAALQAANIPLGNMAPTGWTDGGPAYGQYARAASSFFTALPNGQAAYDWLAANVPFPPVEGMQWNLVKRGAVAPPPPPPPPVAVNGVVGTADGVGSILEPTSGLCSAGTPSAVLKGATLWTWSCAGLNGGTTAQGSAPILLPPPPPPVVVNGSCGASSGVIAAVKPTTGLCSAGAPSVVAGTGPWSWSCAGSNGGSTAQCATLPTIPPPPTVTCSVTMQPATGAIGATIPLVGTALCQ